MAAAASTFPTIAVSSADPYERGRQYGEQAADRVAGSVDVYRETFDHYTGLPWERIRELAAEFRGPIAAYDPAIMREIEGIAAGARLPLEDVLAVNVRTEVMYGISSAAPHECTSFYAGPAATADGHVLMGQNWDWRARCEETSVLVEVDQGDGRSFLMHAEAGLVGKLGWNSDGVGVAANMLVSSRDRGEPGVPFHVVLRGILNARSLEEAVAAVVRARRAASANYLIGSAAGYGVDLETGPGGIESFYTIKPTDDLLAHANNFTCAIDFVDTGLERVPDSPGRTARMQLNLAEHRGALTRESLTELLREHDAHPGSICRHDYEASPPVERACTVMSWVIDLTAGLASICRGRPCEGEYVDLAPSFSRSLVSA
jgi:isopenicillin-N N-acyltransferase-like protein